MVEYKEFMNAINYDVVDGCKYLWKCYGGFAYALDWEGGIKGSASIVFDLRDQTVYEVQVFDDKRERQYRMIHPDFKEAYFEECKEHGIKRDEVFDDLKYIDLESENDFIEKLTAVVNGWDYDDRVSIPLDISDDELLILMKAAHEMDLTFNEFVIRALEMRLEEWKLSEDLTPKSTGENNENV